MMARRRAGVVRGTAALGITLTLAGAIGCGDDDSVNDTLARAESGELSNAEIVKKVLVEGIAGSDASIVEEYVSGDFVQHSSVFPAGRQPLLSFAQIPEKIGHEIHRTLEDGDLVALHGTYTPPDEPTIAVGFDVYRIEDRQIVEHWDVRQALAGPNPSGHSMTDGPTDVEALDLTSANRELVTGFARTVLETGNLDQLEEFVSSDEFVQHDPLIADGVDGLRAFYADLAARQMTSVITGSRLVVAQGNFVLLGSEGSAGPADAPQYAIFYDLFRASAGRIVEHWNVVPVAPNAETLLHDNGFF